MIRWVGVGFVVGCSGGGATEPGDPPVEGTPTETQETCELDTWFVDVDLDGFGGGDAVTDCAEGRPATAVDVGGDCDDADAARSPGAIEVCNGVDDDCDEAVDDDDADVDLTEAPEWYADADADGFGDPASSRPACVIPAGHVDNDDDCDDAAPGTHPDATESCLDTTDVNCDGVDPSDDADADGVAACEDCDESDGTVGLPTPRWLDDDADGYGDASVWVLSCIDLKGWVSNPDDCAPKDDTVHPGASEVCNTVDDDCDLAVDDADDSIDVASQTAFYADGDGDGLGDAATSLARCIQPLGYVFDDTDCDDTESKIGGPTSWWPDDDGDGYGDESVPADVVCDAPPDAVDNSADCNDGDPEINPDTEWFEDGDGDGFGAPGFSRIQCDQPPSYVLDDTDCDDTDELIHPDTEWFEDLDADGYGNADVSVVQCADPGASVLDDTDCDDTSHLVHPTRFDFEDDVDNDCDGTLDEDVGSETVTWDADVQAILDVHCTSCHGNKAPDAGLDLVDGYVNVFEVVAGQLAAMDLVAPGDRRNSYLWRKVDDSHLDAGGTGSMMPPKGGLSDQDLLDLEQWILEGAVQN